jgi:hypothetical protein
MTFDEYWRDAKDGCTGAADETMLKAWAQDAWNHAIRSARPEAAPSKPFIAVGYVNTMGGVTWEPGYGPGDLQPYQLVYVSHIAKPLPQRQPEEDSPGMKAIRWADRGDGL